MSKQFIYERIAPFVSNEGSSISFFFLDVKIECPSYSWPLGHN